MPDSKRSSRGFTQIPEESRTATMVDSPSDAIDQIPLTGVTSKTGARRTGTTKSASTHQPMSFSEKQNNEKAGFYHRHVAGHRRAAAAAKMPGHPGSAEEESTLTDMGRLYNMVLKFSIVTRYFLYILPVALIISIPIIIGATAAPNATLGGVRIVWFFSWVLIVWVALWTSKLTAKLLPSIFQFLCGIVSSGTRKYATVISSLELYLTLAGWALAALATFVPVMTLNPTQQAQADTYNSGKNSSNSTIQNNALLFQYATDKQPWESVVQGILAALLVCSLILLAEKLLIQLISISYHRTQFTEKIRDSKHKIWLLSLLYDASRSLFPAYCPEFAEEDYIINDSIELGDNGRNQGRPGLLRLASDTPVRLLQNVGRFGDKITQGFGNIAHEVTGKQVFNPNSAHSIVVEALEKNKSSEALAKRLWMSFVVEGKEALYLEDVVEVLGADRHAEAEEAFACLDRDGNGDISLDEMVLTVCEFGKDRHSIANSLHDVDEAINVLDSLLLLLVFIACVLVFVGFLNSSFTTTLATAGTALLSLSFVFAATTQEVLSSCIFLFVKHPFDVLDRVDIGGDQLVVKHISLLFTVFKCVNNHKLTQVPNTILNSLWIQNVSRSEAMREQLLLYISFDTSIEDIQLLKNEMQAFVTDKENSRDFQPDIDVEITGIAEMNKMELKVEIRHKSNWSNETVRAARRSKFMCALVLALRKIPINAPGGGAAALGSADQPTYSVSVSDQDAAMRRDEFKNAQDAKRLFPTSKANTTTKKTSRGLSTGAESFNPHDSATPQPLRYRQVPPSESTALNTLNSRHPAADTAHGPSDIIENPTTPKSMANSVSGTADIPPLDRSVSIEEVRGMLRRQSTKGKRKSPKSSSYASKLALTSDTTARPLPPPTARIDYASSRPVTPKADPPPQTSAKIDFAESAKFEYDPYSYSSFPESPPQLPMPVQPPPARSQPQQAQPSLLPTHSLPSPHEPKQRPPPPPSMTSGPRPTPTLSPSPKPEKQPTPPPKNSPPRSKPTQPSLITTQPTPPPQLSNNTLSPSSPSTTTADDPTTGRSRSPIRNPFQINALKAQQQAGGVGVPRAVQRPPSEVAEQSHTPVGARNESLADSPTIGVGGGLGGGGGGGINIGPAAPVTAAVRRPVPGAGNSFARDSGAGGGVIPPPRGDSLAGGARAGAGGAGVSGAAGQSFGQTEWDKVE